MTSGIYQITNLVNKKVYIGSAVYLERRKSQHFSDLRKDKHSNSHLQASYNLYGLESFKWETLQLVNDANHLIAVEQTFIDYYKRLLGWNKMYNLAPTAGSSLGLKRSEEVKRKKSESMKGEKHHLFGKTRSEESRRNMSLAQQGEKSHMWGKFGAEHHNSKPVEAVCVVTGKTTLFGSAREATRQWPGVNNRHVSDCCLNKLKTHFKHYWRFV